VIGRVDLASTPAPVGGGVERLAGELAPLDVTLAVAGRLREGLTLSRVLGLRNLDLDKNGLPDYPGLTSADCKAKVQEWCGKLGCATSGDQWVPCNPSGTTGDR
jgi:hypothetical protein